MHRCDARDTAEKYLSKNPSIDISVTEATVWNWEHGTEPELRHMPKIIDEFLGYMPFECPENPIGKLRYFKLVNGLSYKRLGFPGSGLTQKKTYLVVCDEIQSGYLPDSVFIDLRIE